MRKPGVNGFQLSGVSTRPPSMSKITVFLRSIAPALAAAATVGCGAAGALVAAGLGAGGGAAATGGWAGALGAHAANHRPVATKAIRCRIGTPKLLFM